MHNVNWNHVAISALLFAIVVGLVVYFITNKKKETTPDDAIPLPSDTPDKPPLIVAAPLAASGSLSSAAENLDQISRIPDGIKEITFKSTVNWTKVNKGLPKMEDGNTSNFMATTHFTSPIGALVAKRPELHPTREYKQFAFEINTDVTRRGEFEDPERQGKDNITHSITITPGGKAQSFIVPASGIQTLTTTLKLEGLYEIYPYTSSVGGQDINGEMVLDTESFIKRLRTSYVKKGDLADYVEISWKS